MKTILRVVIDTDIPGWGHHSRDHVKLVDDFLMSNIPWYFPKVTLVAGRLDNGDILREDGTIQTFDEWIASITG